MKHAPAPSSPGHVPTDEDFLTLAGTTWRVWRTVVLRGAGFPVRLVDRLGDEALAHAADCALATGSVAGRVEVDRTRLARYEREFDAAAARAAEAVDAMARDVRFREAVAWQNRELLDTCLDRGDGATRRNTRTRQREAAIASYLQRYTTKNDSIGYFGPVGWASWHPTGAAVHAAPGPELLSRRTVYFESWAIDAVSAALVARPAMLHGIPPRRVPANHVCGGRVHLPVGTAIQLTTDEADILRLCDGTRTVREVVEAHADAGSSGSYEHVLERVLSLRDQGLICLDLGGPIDAFPDRLLRQRLTRSPDPEARVAALRDLDRLVADKDNVARAAGDADAVAEAIDHLNHTFELVTGVPRARLHGQTYAGRTIIYEDAVRDIDLRLGPEPAAALAGPLALVLDSGRWLAARVGADCLDRLDGYYERRRRRSGCHRVPLASLLALATRDLYAQSRMPPIAAGAAAELQRRWSRILAIPAGSRRHEVAVSDIASAVAQEFASTPPSWAGGLVHSPDVMIAAASVDAINRGDYRFVLGELHVAFNTMESRALVEQSPDKGRLLSMVEAVAGGRRIVPVAPRAWGAVTARTSPPSAMLSPSFVYWAMGTDDVSNLPVDPIPVAALEVVRVAGDLVVHDRGSRRNFPLVEVIGEYVSGAVVNAFRMLPPARHTARVAIGRLIVARESWRMPVRKCAWAFQLDERRRYLQMREWLGRHGIPRRAFYTVSIETKPAYVDFTSIPLVNVLASIVRKVAKNNAAGDITFAEMLPDSSETWLPDARGQQYTCELRMVAVDGTR